MVAGFVGGVRTLRRRWRTHYSGSSCHMIIVYKSAGLRVTWEGSFLSCRAHTKQTIAVLPWHAWSLLCLGRETALIPERVTAACVWIPHRAALSGWSAGNFSLKKSGKCRLAGYWGRAVGRSWRLKGSREGGVGKMNASVEVRPLQGFGQTKLNRAEWDPVHYSCAAAWQPLTLQHIEHNIGQSYCPGHVFWWESCENEPLISCSRASASRCKQIPIPRFPWPEQQEHLPGLPN